MTHRTDSANASGATASAAAADTEGGATAPGQAGEAYVRSVAPSVVNVKMGLP